MNAHLALWAAPAGAVGLLAAALVYRWVRQQPAGTEAMRDIAQLIAAGARIFLTREYTALGPFVVVVAALLAGLIGPWTGLAYAAGGACSVLAGLLGMTAATRANVRTAEAARSRGQGPALTVAFLGGSVMGLAVASLGLLGIGAIVWLWWHGGVILNDPAWRAFSQIITGFAMGASSIALFARVGGGIYTKAADVGADLVGKIEVGIPEDDARNPAAIADNVGDNVGDVAGMGADIFESYVGAVIAHDRHRRNAARDRRPPERGGAADRRTRCAAWRRASWPSPRSASSSTESRPWRCASRPSWRPPCSCSPRGW